MTQEHDESVCAALVAENRALREQAERQEAALRDAHIVLAAIVEFVHDGRLDLSDAAIEAADPGRLVRERDFDMTTFSTGEPSEPKSARWMHGADGHTSAIQLLPGEPGKCTG